MNRFWFYILFILFVSVIAVIVSFFIPNLFSGIGVAHVARIPIHGELAISESMLSSTSGVDTILRDLSAAATDPKVSAILLDIDSPGGGPVASHEVVNFIENIDKPVIAWIREVGASGAYWIASACDYIIADPISLVGSVGVLSGFVEITGFMEKYGLNYVRASSGEMKDLGIPFRNITLAERERLDEFVNKMFVFFSEDVKKRRNLTEESFALVKTSDIFLGSEALELGLVDEVGGYDSMVNYLAVLTGSEITFDKYGNNLSVLDLLSKLSFIPNVKLLYNNIFPSLLFNQLFLK